MRERDLLQHVFAANAGLPADVTIPPGDDMGAIRFGDKELLVTVDQLADGVHVNVANTPIELVGRKAITRNLSDVAAMAALPVGAVAAAALPRDFAKERADALFDAMRATAEQYDCPLIGGDVTIWDGPLMITVTVFADPAGIKPVLRSGAKPGDAIFVTGALGGAWREDGGGAHLTFEPRIQFARTLAESLGDNLHAMIDLSDGLATDLGHICKLSAVGCEIDETTIPLRPEVNGKIDRGLSDGEDYELCFTTTPNTNPPDEISDVAITMIGKVFATTAPPIMLIGSDKRRALRLSGYEHQSE